MSYSRPQLIAKIDRIISPVQEMCNFAGITTITFITPSGIETRKSIKDTYMFLKKLHEEQYPEYIKLKTMTHTTENYWLTISAYGFIDSPHKNMYPFSEMCVRVKKIKKCIKKIPLLLQVQADEIL